MPLHHWAVTPGKKRTLFKRQPEWEGWLPRNSSSKMRQTACYQSAATGGLQETMFTYTCRAQALADTRIPQRACTSQLTEFQPVGGAHEQAFHAAGILMLVLMLLIPELHKAPQQALLTLPHWQHCLQFSERWLELAWTTGSFKILYHRESSSHNEDYRSTGKRPSPRDPPSHNPRDINFLQKG